MEIVKVNENNKHIYLNLAQAYEGEFSAITEKKPDEDGLFALDTHLSEHVLGFLLFVDHVPAGLAAVAVKEKKQYEVCEFYIVPSFRLHHLGMNFAHALWSIFPGRWEIKQIVGAEYATIFWRKTICAYTKNGYREERYQDPYWGVVTRQQFICDDRT